MKAPRAEVGKRGVEAGGVGRRITVSADEKDLQGGVGEITTTKIQKAEVTSNSGVCTAGDVFEGDLCCGGRACCTYCNLSANAFS